VYISCLLSFIRHGTTWIIIKFAFCPEMRETFQCSSHTFQDKDVQDGERRDHERGTEKGKGPNIRSEN